MDEQNEETTVDPKALRIAVLDATATGWLLVGDIQSEVIAARERAGIDRPHVPVQMVRATCDELVEDQRLDVQMVDIVAGTYLPTENGAHAQFRRKADDRSATKRRREAVVRHLMPAPGAPEAVNDLAGLIERLAAESIHATDRLLTEDLADLQRAGAVVPNTVGGVTAYALRESAGAELLAIGAAAIAERSISAPGLLEVAGDTPDPRAEEVIAQLKSKHEEELSEVRSARAKAEQERTKLATFLIDVGQDVNEILGRKVAPPRTYFPWTQHRLVDLAEKGVILDEIKKLEARRDAVKLRFDGAKSSFKAATEVLEEEIQALKDAADCHSRVLTVQAYRVVDWAAGVEIIHAEDDHRELARGPIGKVNTSPIPIGTQLAIAGTQTPPAPVADGTEPSALGALPTAGEAAPAADLPSEPQPLTDFRAALLGAFSTATGPLTEEGLFAALKAAWVCPEGFEALSRMTLSRLVDEKALKLVQGRPRSWMLPAPPAEKQIAAVAEDGDEDDGASEPDDDEDGEAEADGVDVEEAPKPRGKKPSGAAKRTRASKPRKRAAEARP